MSRSFSIIHFSDLHFGRIQPQVLKQLDDFLVSKKDEIKMAILTGDLTQRAKKEEFLAAKEFISSLSSPLFIVPGNHDVPLYNVFLRLFSPYKKFLRYLGPFAKNTFEDDDIAIYGLWTPNNFSIQAGKIHRSDLLKMEQFFETIPKHKVRFIACHHPIVSMKHSQYKEDIERLHNLKAHFLLWGHEHQSSISTLGEGEFPMILASGTTTSTRTRDEANSFNYITFNDDDFSVEVYRHSDLLGSFEVIDKRDFRGGLRPPL